MPSDEITMAATMLREIKASRASAIGPGAIEDRRAAAESMVGVFPLPDDIEVLDVSASGVAAELVTTPGVAGDRFVLYLHGGAYVAFSPRTHRELAARIGRAAGTSVLVPDYRLAPEHPFPAALDDALATYDFLLAAHGIAPERLAVAGDSAGGGLTLALLLALRERNAPLPAAAALLSPWTDLAGTGASFEERADRDPMLDPASLLADAARYAGTADPAAPLLSPLNADLAGLPPMLVQVGTEEILLDDSTRLSERAAQHGVDVTLEVGEGLFHVYQAISVAPEATDATDRIGAFLRRHLGP